MPLGIRTSALNKSAFSKSAFSKAASATCIAGAIAFSVLAGSMSASAAPVTCESLGATTIAPGVCQIAVVAGGTFTAPAGVTHLEALLVAGANAGEPAWSNFNAGYGGQGGEILYVDNVPVGAPVTVVVGSGGVVAGAAPTNTSITAGSFSATAAAASGLFQNSAGWTPSGYVNDVSAGSALFPAYVGEGFLAGSGADGTNYAPGDEPVDTAYTQSGGGTGGAFVNALANTGSGGGGADLVQGDPETDVPGGNGGSGVVLFRFAPPEAAVAAAALAVTGTDSAVAASAAGVLLLGGAVALAATTAKRRRSARA